MIGSSAIEPDKVLIWAGLTSRELEGLRTGHPARFPLERLDLDGSELVLSRVGDARTSREDLLVELAYEDLRTLESANCIVVELGKWGAGGRRLPVALKLTIADSEDWLTEKMYDDGFVLPGDAVSHPGEASSQFAALVDRIGSTYFAEILPRYVDRYFRGAGYELMFKLLEAHDRRTIEKILEAPPPTDAALRRARSVRDSCPLIVRSHRAPDAPKLYGRFQYRSMTSRVNVGGGEFEHSADQTRFVELFEEAFVDVAAASAEALEAEVMHTIFHEYIHYFESFTHEGERHLSARENADTRVIPLTLEEAIRKDDVVLRRRAMKGMAFALVGILGLGVALAATCGR